MAWYRGVTGGYQRQLYGQQGNGGRPLSRPVMRGVNRPAPAGLLLLANLLANSKLTL